MQGDVEDVVIALDARRRGRDVEDVVVALDATLDISSCTTIISFVVLQLNACFSSSSRTDFHDDVVDVTSLSALDVVEININT